jgi:UDPglucose 6-dehydrogenase
MLAVAQEIGEKLTVPALIVDKSTVPVGTADKVKAVLSEQLQKRHLDLDFDVVSNPEFLKEGAAIADFMSPDRIVIGASQEHSFKVMSELYAAFSRNHDKILTMGVRDAEMTKYAANAMLATKISFMNEMALMCEKFDVENVRRGIGSDARIGYSFIYPGAGYEGSCFPKDVRALVSMAEAQGVDAHIFAAVEKRNQAQKSVLLEKNH